MVIDLVIIALVVICVLIGAKRGLVLSMISVLSLVIALVVGYLLMPVIGSAINKTPLSGKTENMVYVYVHDALSDTLAKEDPDMVGLEEVPAEDKEVDYKTMLEESNLPAFIKNKVEKAIDKHAEGEQTVENISRIAAKAITSAVIKILSVLLVAVVVFVLLSSMKFIWKGLRNISVLRRIDTVGGVVFGLGQSILIVCTIMLVISLISAAGFASGTTALIRSSFLGKFLFEHNFLGLLIALFI